MVKQILRAVNNVAFSLEALVFSGGLFARNVEVNEVSGGGFDSWRGSREITFIIEAIPQTNPQASRQLHADRADRSNINRTRRDATVNP